MFILAIDQGTTGSTALVVDREGRTLGRATAEFPQHFPKPGWVEHEPSEIWASVETAVRGALRAAQITDAQIGAIGITNQRETTVLWDRATQTPIHRAIVWQCRRTAAVCDALKEKGLEPMFRDRTGLVLDAYFSGTKIGWILDHVAGARARADKGELAFGTIDTFVVSKLTAGTVHVTDVTNASRTLLMNLRDARWDPELLSTLGVPMSVLPTIVGNAEVVGHTKKVGFLRDGIPIAGMAGDQQAALFGQACFREGDAKCTYGTGAFALVNIGAEPKASRSGLVTTAAWRIGGTMTYALEGSAFIAGAAVQWLRDGLGIIKSAADIESLARGVAETDGVYFVPALTGLGAPHWDQAARGLVCGITRGTTAAHLARATLEGIAWEVRDLLHAMANDAGRALTRLRVDGGACRNNILMQMQADFADVRVERPTEIESTGRGAAMLAGIGAGMTTLENAQTMLKIDAEFAPELAPDVRQRRLAGWEHAVRRARA